MDTLFWFGMLATVSMIACAGWYWHQTRDDRYPLGRYVDAAAFGVLVSLPIGYVCLFFYGVFAYLGVG